MIEFKIIPKTFHIFQYKNRFQNLKTGFFFFLQIQHIKIHERKKKSRLLQNEISIYIYQITIVHRLDI